MRRTTCCLYLTISLLAALPACAAPETAASTTPELQTDDEKTLYALGLALSQRLRNFDLKAGEVSLIQAGLADGILGREAKVPLETWGPRIDGLLKGRSEAVTAKEREAGAAFAAEAAKGAGAQLTESGLVYVEMEPGSGASPSPTDTVQLQYKGSFRDGTVFDQSEEGGEPVTFALDGVVQCFSEGISKMKVGGTSKLICPPDIAYGDQGYPPVIPPGATLVFEVKLVGILDEAASETAPPPSE